VCPGFRFPCFIFLEDHRGETVGNGVCPADELDAPVLFQEELRSAELPL
jgi:hypothetical protein